MALDLTAESPVNFAACAYRDYRAGILSQDGAALILARNLRLPSGSAVAVLNAEPGSEALARILCGREGWQHHARTDGYPCSGCKGAAATLSEAALASSPAAGVPVTDLPNPRAEETPPPATGDAIEAFRRAFLLAGGPIGAEDDAIRAGLEAAARTGVPAGDPMPVFVIKAKDRLAVAAVSAYRRLCEGEDLHDQARQVRLAAAEISAWRERNPELVKLPGHPHVPAAGTSR